MGFPLRTKWWILCCFALAVIAQFLHSQDSGLHRDSVKTTRPAPSQASTVQHRTRSEMNGTWKPVYQEIGGNAFPKEVFSKQVLVLKDSVYVFSAESVDKGVALYDTTRMDIIGREGVNVGKHFRCYYSVGVDSLKICYDLSGVRYPSSFATKGQPTFFLCVFKRSSP